jgi:hypothetical protein
MSPHGAHNEVLSNGADTQLEGSRAPDRSESNQQFEDSIPRLERISVDDSDDDCDNDSMDSGDAGSRLRTEECDALVAELGGNRRPCVSFGGVQVREHEIVVGDNPEVLVGPPISLGWGYNQHRSMTLQEFIEWKRSKSPLCELSDAVGERRDSAGTVGKERGGQALRLSSRSRRHILMDVFGYDVAAIRSAEKEVRAIQEQRWATVKQVRAAVSVDEPFRSVFRE